MTQALAGGLVDYEQTKFALAEILRFADFNLRKVDPANRDAFRDLFARLAEDRFNLVVVGRFSRGKSSLMNAMLNSERLPTGILPLTSVITTVSYGSTEKVWIDHENWSIAEEISIDDLPSYVTQDGNPGNERKVSTARIELPAELLRRGFHFVDTPGLGSSIVENTRTTEQFLPQADAFMLITSFDSPLSEEELRVVKGAVGSGVETFLVVNKHDTVPAEERAKVLKHIEAQTRTVFDGFAHQVFSVSAAEAIDANRTCDSDRWEASGVGHLRDELTRFLLGEKQQHFLARMCDRIGEAIRDVPGIADERARLEVLRAQLAGGRLRHTADIDTGPSSLSAGTKAFRGCPICIEVEHAMYDVLCTYQYDVAVDKEVQAALVRNGGLCAFHTWHYEAIASPHGTCMAFPRVLERLANALRDLAGDRRDGHQTRVEALLPDKQHCALCIAQDKFEDAAIAKAARSVRAAHADGGRGQMPAICLHHLPATLAALPSDDPACAELLALEAGALDRLAEDMRRYAVKHEGVKRHLASDEETGADRKALLILAGDRNLTGTLRRH
jgi:GTP-binding protein EngB required for normal cell division